MTSSSDVTIRYRGMEFDEHQDLEQEEEGEDEEEEEEEMRPAPLTSAKTASSGGGGDAAAGSSTAAKKSSAPVRYRECQKNHAVGIGGHAVDGCGEFMAAGKEGSLDALKCAACNCHRNFHRKEVDPRGGGAAVGELITYHHPPPPPPPPHFSPYHYRGPPPPHIHFSPAPHRPLALPATAAAGSGGGGGGNYSREEEDVSNPSSSGGGGGTNTSNKKKRHRTKFTAEQKEMMRRFSERLGWRIQKHDEAAVEQFCSETGIKRKVLKVWMHNNKNTLGKEP